MRTRPVAVGLALFVGLLCWKWSCLWNPPYNEYAEAFWTEAAYLAETNFDFAALWNQPQIAEGGVRAYVVSVLTALLALLIQCVPAPLSLVVVHLIELACAAAVMAWTLSVVQREFGALRSLLVCAAVFTMPYFSVHLEMLGMELPLTVGIIAVLAAYGTSRPVTAASLAAAAFFLKPTTLPLSAALACCLAGDVVFSSSSYKVAPRRVRLALAIVAISLAAQTVLLRRLAADAQTVHESFLTGVILSLILGTLCLPYLGPVLLFIVVQGLRNLRSAEGDPAGKKSAELPSQPRRQMFERCRGLLDERPGLALAASYLILALASMVLVMPAPRYFVALTPALALVLAEAAWRHNRASRTAAALLCLLLAHNLLNHAGRWLVPPPANTDLNERNLAFPERSFQYRRDLASAVLGLRLASELSPGEPVLAGKLATQMMASPRMGYVAQPPRGYTVLDHFSLGALRPAVEILADRPATLVVIGCHTSECRLPPPRPEDEILYDDELDPPLVIYRRTFGQGADRAVYEAFYRDLVEANPQPAIPYSVATAGGNNGRSQTDLRRRMARLDVAPELLQWLGQLFDELGSPAVADAARHAAEEKAKKIAP